MAEVRNPLAVTDFYELCNLRSHRNEFGSSSRCAESLLPDYLFCALVRGAFPYGTFFINITGAFLMSFFITVTSKLAIFPQLNLLVAVGFLGSYTRFSTYALDTSNLLRTKNYQARNTLLAW